MFFEVKDYQANNGKYYVREFLVELASKNKKLWAITIEKIRKLSDSNCHRHLLKPLKDKLFELKPRIGSDTARIFICLGRSRTIWILSGIIKKDDKRQQRAIEQARKLKAECERREKYEY